MLSERGVDACGGMLVTKKGGVRIFKQEGRSYDYVLDVWPLIEAASPLWLALHTRAATVGKASNPNNNHPVQYGGTLVTHNGSVTNVKEVFEKLHKKPGAEVDTEAIAAALDVGGLEKALDVVRGSMAIAWVDSTAPTNLHLYTNGPPLWVSEKRTGLVYASSLDYLPTKLLGESREVGVGEHLTIGRTGIVAEKVGQGKTRHSAFFPVQTHNNWYLCYDLTCLHNKDLGRHLHRYPSHTTHLHESHGKEIPYGSASANPAN